jgi:hypothetical protein
MRTTTTILNALRDARGRESVLSGDALDGVVADLEELQRREREWDQRLQQLESARDDDTPRGAPFDEVLMNPEHL